MCAEYNEYKYYLFVSFSNDMKNFSRFIVLFSFDSFAEKIDEKFRSDKNAKP